MIGLEGTGCTPQSAAWSELPAHACCQIYASAESGAPMREFGGVLIPGAICGHGVDTNRPRNGTKIHIWLNH
jgi:hypothetical protein